MIRWARTVVTNTRLLLQKRKFSSIPSEETIDELSNSSRYSTLLFLILTAALASQAYAQMGGGEFAATIAENSKKLKQYTYTQKTQVYFKGELRTTKMSQVHFDPTTGKK